MADDWTYKLLHIGRTVEMGAAVNIVTSKFKQELQ